MAASIINPPAAIGYNGNDKYVTVGSDLQTAAAAYVDLIFSAGGPAIAETFELNWGGNSITFTVAATTNITATAIPTKGAESLDAYAIRVGEAFRENYLILEHWIVTAHAGGRVRLTNIIVGILDIVATETMSNTAMTVVDGVDNTVANLAAHFEVWKKGTIFSLDERIAVLHSPYDATLVQTEFNIKDLFPLKPSIPNENSIGFTIGLSWKRAVASAAFMEFYIRVADKYGAPVTPEALLKTEDTYIMLHGARPEDHDNVNTLGTILPLHGYRQQDGLFKKPVTDVQPDWFYFFAPTAISAARVEFEITWDDGTITTETPASTPYSFAAKTAYWIRSTPYNLSALIPPADGVLPWYYTFRLIGNDGSGELTLAGVDYVVKPCTDWDVYLLMDNGLGGCESVLFRGKSSYGMEASRDTARRARSSQLSIVEGINEMLQQGEIFTFNAEGQKVWELSSGWHDLYYIKHIRQLLFADVWLIDTEQKRFLKLTVESSNIITHEDDVELYAIQVKVKTAWIDRAQNP
jgi:hypothetical protein